MKFLPGQGPNKAAGNLVTVPDDDLKLLIGAAEDRREAGRRKKAAGRLTGRTAKRRAREHTAKASRKRNRR